MKKIFNIFKYTTVALLVLVAGVLILLSVINLNNYKTPISNLLTSTIGKPTTINGDIKLGISLQPSIVLHDLSIANPDWTSTSNLLEVKKLKVSFATIPLLQRKIQVKNLRIEQATINLEQRSKRQNNWDIHLDNKNTQQKKTSQSDISKINEWFLLAPQKIKLINLAINYLDRTNNNKHALAIAEARIVKHNTTFDFAINGNYQKTSFTSEGQILATNDNAIKLIVKNKLLGGSNKINLLLKPQNNYWQQQLQLIINNIDAGKMFNLLGISNNYRNGKLDLKFNHTGRQLSAQTLNGLLDVVLLNTQLNTSKSSIHGSFLRLLAGEGLNGIQVNCALARIKFSNGIGDAQTLVFDTKGALVRGKGTINMRNEKLDLVLHPTAKGVSLTSLAVPFTVTGTITRPIILPTKKSFLTQLGKYAIGAATGVGLVAMVGFDVGKNLLKKSPTNPCVKALQN
ncbi:MAG: hypothetical protein Tsb005_16140 [Gammaproteobacteria bacterium]